MVLLVSPPLGDQRPSGKHHRGDQESRSSLFDIRIDSASERTLPSSHRLTLLDQHGRCLSLRARFAVHFAGRTGRSASRQEFSIRTSIFRQRILGIRQSPLVPPFPRFSLVPACMDSTFSTSTTKSTVSSTFPPSISPTPRKSAPRSRTRRRTARTRTSSAGSASSPRISRSPARSGRFLMQ